MVSFAAKRRHWLSFVKLMFFLVAKIPFFFLFLFKIILEAIYVLFGFLVYFDLGVKWTFKSLWMSNIGFNEGEENTVH